MRFQKSLLVLGVLVAGNAAWSQTKPAEVKPSVEATVESIRAEMARLKLPSWSFSREGSEAFRAVSDNLRDEDKAGLIKAIGEWRDAHADAPEYVELNFTRWELMAPPLQANGARRRFSRAVAGEAYSNGTPFGQESLVGKLRHLEYHVTAAEEKVIGDLETWWPNMFGMAERTTADYPGNNDLAELWGRLIELGDAGPDKEKLGEWFVEAFKETRAAREFGLRKMIDGPLELEFTDALTGNTVKTKDLAGKPVVVLFWSPRTARGRAGLERVKAIAEKAGDKAAFVGVAVGAPPDAVKAECARVGVTWPQWVLEKSGEGFAWEKGVEVGNVPATWIVDGEGVLKTISAEGKLEKRLERMGVLEK